MKGLFFPLAIALALVLPGCASSGHTHEQYQPLPKIEHLTEFVKENNTFVVKALTSHELLGFDVHAAHGGGVYLTWYQQEKNK